MQQRFATIWFRHLTTDRMIRKRPDLREVPFVLAAPERGRMVVRAASPPARQLGIMPGMVVADARALFPSVEVLDDVPGETARLLLALAEWCIRYTPIVAADPPDGLILDITGCAHLWGGEHAYLMSLVVKLQSAGYDVGAAVADTIGAAWAVSRYGQAEPVVRSGGQREALLTLPPEALRLPPETLARMFRLGFYQIQTFIAMPHSVLRRRFGQHLPDRLNQALGYQMEYIESVQPLMPYHERLPCVEPILTATGIEIALRRLLEMLCGRLSSEGKGLRSAVFKCYRIDGQVRQIAIGTNRGTGHVAHLFRLFALKISTIAPGLGIELFVLEAPVVEDLPVVQEKIWNQGGHTEDVSLTELLDRLAVRAGMDIVRRYLPDEHHWPERSVKLSSSLTEKAATSWRSDRVRPVHLLARPEMIRVTSVLPDYPPVLFIYQGKVHKISRAEGPERIEREWWLETGQHRDYYCVEDEEGARYWIFRLGHYDDVSGTAWFLHGFFA
ncbi:Y-family DNA polymerase [Dyadobacter sandarakinus]|uniref:DNA polymerase Y family protein n=1 Tax=Dyadobacter sandarakinus TaxID=2747268 RepID=A0ABX7I6I2_9BACT|nr:DNA polymerase Y family protein [Dyadobacter sandarakinus]QRR00591.1 DNA polymerase Y family protein [Dyadobacter sandarakinus]